MDVVNGESPEIWTPEIEPEVREFLESLTPGQYGQAEASFDLLLEAPTTLGEPHAKHLGDGLRELRLRIHPNDWRMAYWLAPGRRIILLTVFRKTRQIERREIQRALDAMKVCQADHAPATHSWEYRLARPVASPDKGGRRQ